MKDAILKELAYDTVSFPDYDGNTFTGIENTDFNELADRLVKLFMNSIPTPQECMEYVSGNPSFTSGCNYMRHEIEKRMKNA